MRDAAFMDIVTPALAYRAIVNRTPLSQIDVMRWIWTYIHDKYLKDHAVVDRDQDRLPDDVFDQASVDLFSMNKLLVARAEACDD